MRALLVSLFLTACTTAAQAPAPEAHNHLAGTSWVMTDNPAAAATPPTIEFTSDRASGFAGCNRWFAGVEHDGEALRFGDAGMTRMMCEEGPTAVEQAFANTLSNTRYGHYDRDVLVLLDEHQQVIARFNRTN